MYQSSILSINYDKLKKLGIKCLLFDLDNTICINKNNDINMDVIKLIKKLKDDFNIIIVSNSSKIDRVRDIASIIDVSYYYFSMKPLSRTFKRIMKKYNYKRQDLAMIGDQLLTDIYGANRMGIYSILIDPLSKEDITVTKFNRKIENIIFKKYKDKIKKGEYYG